MLENMGPEATNAGQAASLALAHLLSLLQAHGRLVCSTWQQAPLRATVPNTAGPLGVAREWASSRLMAPDRLQEGDGYEDSLDRAIARL